MEHRWGNRQTLDVCVTLYVESKLPSIGRLLNASSSGAYVATNAILPNLTRVRVVIGRERSRPGARRIPAYVVRADGRGIGIEWQEFAPAGVLALIAAMQEPPMRTRAQASLGGDRAMMAARAGRLYLPSIRSERASSSAPNAG
jgi:hypothetical protein